ncbi:MAG: ATP-binding protein [Lentisphaeria bacterium]|nr:ATP-binding protein [Lentisphaeria bacterium]
MLASELNLLIDKQREEWKLSNGVLREKMRGIPVLDNYATIISGIRRCGKSTLLRQWQSIQEQPTLMLSFDDLRMTGFTQDDFRVLDYVIAGRKARVLLFDEIQTIPHWELYIRQKLDEGCSCLVTGSNASMLSRELGTKLTGRHIDVELAPFSFNEFLAFSRQERTASSFRDYLSRGGMPGYLSNGNSEVLRTLLDDIIYRDIAVRYGLGDVNLLRSLCLYLFGNLANLVNPSRLLQTFKVRSATTMLEYFSYLEQAYLVHRMLKFSHSIRAQQLAPKKIYIADSALHGLGQVAPTPDMGYLLENAVYGFLRQRWPEIHYFADDGCECDFVVQDAHGAFQAFQVCWELTDACRERELRGLESAMKRLGLKEGVIVTFDQRDFAIMEGREVHVVPAWEFFK